MVLPDYEEDDVLKALRLICADPQATLPFRRNTSPQATAPKKLTPRQPNFVHRLFSKRGHVPSQTEVSRALDITKAGELRIDLLAKAQTDQRRAYMTRMAGFDPGFQARQLGGARSSTRKAAQEQQRLIHDKLKKGGMPIPRYDIIDLIGKGNYGRVYLGKDYDHNRLAAIKVIDADAVDYLEAPHDAREQTITDFQQEVKVLSVLKERKVINVNTIYDVFVVYDQLWIITEFCAGGSVHTLMHAQKDKIKERYIIPIIREVVKGVAKIHEAGIIHRDLKAANIMITEYGGVQIIDFGVAATIEPWADKRATFIGTLNWMAPEFHKMNPNAIQYGTEVDIWAIGITIFEMVNGRPPYAKARDKRWLGMELKRNPPRLQPSEEVSKELCAFMEWILQVAPEKRPKATDILDHPYIKGTEKSHPTSLLVDLVIEFNQWESEGGSRYSLFLPNDSESNPEQVSASDEEVDTSWRFSMVSSGDLDLFDIAKANDDVDFEQAVTKPADLRRAPSIKVDGQHDFPSSYNRRYDLNGFALAPELESPFEASAEAQVDNLERNGKNPNVKGVNVDQRAAKRGENQLASLFNENQRPYHFGQEDDLKSDLPLRNLAAGSDARTKEVLAPDPNKSRVLGSAAIPDIGSVNIETIKQNRKLNKSGFNQSDSSGDEYSDSQVGRQPKRATMAWEPEWNVPSSEEPPPPPDPFAQFGYNNEGPSATNFLAPPTALQRPGIHQANSAPGDLPTTNTLANAARASTASALDLDALMGDDLYSSDYTSTSYHAPNDSLRHPSHELSASHEPSRQSSDYGSIQSEPEASLDNYSGRTSYEMSQIETEVDGIQGSQQVQSESRGDDSLAQSNNHGDGYQFSPEDIGLGVGSPINADVPPLDLKHPGTPPLPPNPEAMEDGADPQVVEAELRRLLSGMISGVTTTHQFLEAFSNDGSLDSKRVDEESGDELEDDEQSD